MPTSLPKGIGTAATQWTGSHLSQLYGVVDLGNELRSEPAGSLFVPQRGCIECQSGGPQKDDRKGDAFRRLPIDPRISSEETTSSGLASCSTIRRSSSDRWASVSGIAAA